MRYSALLAFVVACAPSGSGSDGTSDDGGGGGGIPSNLRVVVLTRDRPEAPLEAVGTVARWGAPLWPRIENAPPGSHVMLTAQMKGYTSHGEYLVDDSGIVDVTTASAIAGTYTGVEPDGLVWSLTKDAAATITDPALLSIAVELDHTPVTKVDVTRSYLSDGMTKTPVTANGLAAELYMPAGDGPFPGLIAWGGSEGGIESGEWFADYWVGRGYAVLALAYFGYGSTPQYLEKIPVEYFGHAITFMKNQPKVDATKLGVLGVSRGGEAALLVGATYTELAAIVAEVPSGVSWGAPQQDGTEQASWTKAGTGIPFIPWTAGNASEQIMYPAGAGTSYMKGFLKSVMDATQAQKDAATFHVERAKGRYLMFGGSDDQIWPSCPLAEIAHQRLVAAGRTGDEIYCFTDSGHWMGVPGTSTLDMQRVYHPVFNEWLALGGTPAGTAHAQRDSTDREITFLTATLGGH